MIAARKRRGRRLARSRRWCVAALPQAPFSNAWLRARLAAVLRRLQQEPPRWVNQPRAEIRLLQRVPPLEPWVQLALRVLPVRRALDAHRVEPRLAQSR